MDIQLNTLLVALMFVTVLCMGIGNIMVSLADIFNHATASRRDRVHVAWIVLILLIHFNLFWHTKEILAAENWHFGSFLLAIAGPVLLFFATSILLTEPPPDVKPNLPTFFVGLGRRFFLMFALVQAWVVVVSFSLTGSFVLADLANIAMATLATILALSPNERVHNLGIWLAWGIIVIMVVIRWLGA
jgi:hypothetical protein